MALAVIVARQAFQVIAVNQVGQAIVVFQDIAVNQVLVVLAAGVVIQV